LYEKNFFYALVKHRAFDFTDFLASIGGLLGLIAGVSIISLLEILFFLVSVSCRKLIELKKKSKIEPELERREVIVAWSEESGASRISSVTMSTSSSAASSAQPCTRTCRFFETTFQLSSIHGVNQIVNERQNVVGKVVWTILVLTSILTSGLQIKDYAKNAEMNPVAFEIDEKLWSVEEVEQVDQIWVVSDHLLNFQIEFPSVTYCPGLDAVKATRYQECYFDSAKCFDNLTSESM
jgi:uncharacterized membrane protein (Fun14 family)